MKQSNRVFYFNFHGIYPGSRNQLTALGSVYVGRWKAYLASLCETMHDFANQSVGVTQAKRSHLNLSGLQERADNRRTDIDTIQHKGLIMDDLNTEFIAITHVIFKIFLAVVPETIVVTDDKLLDIQSVMQHLPHEIKGRQACRCFIKRQYGSIVYPRF